MQIHIKKANEVTARRWPSIHQPERLQREPALRHLDLGLPASRIGGQNISVVSAPGLWDFLTAA